MRSMTGYGAGAADAPTARVQVELRGVNQRFLDVKVALPREYAGLETEVRERVRALAARGRVDVAVTRTPLPARRRYRIGVRDDLARSYVEAARRLGRRLGIPGTVAVADVLRLPELFEVSEEAPALAPERTAVRRALGKALRAFAAERRREGAALQRDLLARAARLRSVVAEIHRRQPAATAALEMRVRERVARLAASAELEPQRLAQEVIGFVERSDFTEEVVRLDSHLAALVQTLRAPGAIGKRVEFLLQEVQRELNTTGAKNGDLAIGELVVAGKGEVEKLREQVQNIE